MNTHSMLFTSEELLILRDACVEEYQRLKAFKQSRGEGASELLIRRVDVLDGLKETFKDKCRVMK